MSEDKDLHRKCYGSGKIVRSQSDIPDEPHLAIIDFSSVTIPGDERSRTHPGHGYSESTEQVSTYRVWKLEERDCWEHAIMERESPRFSSYRKNYVAMDCGRKVKIKSQIIVGVD